MVKPIVLGLFLFSSLATAQTPEMACDTRESMCSDECVYFKDDIVFLGTVEGALLKYQGKVLTLQEKKHQVVRRLHPEATLPGHTTKTRYAGEGIKATMTSVVLDQSCHFQDKKGHWIAAESCCGGKSKVQLDIETKGKRKSYKTEWAWGC